MQSNVKRFIDYFVVVSVGKTLALDSPEGGGGGGASLMQTKRIDSIYKGDIIARWPLTNHEDAPLPPHFWMFCNPGGLALSLTASPPKFFIFALTEIDGARFYGACLTCYEPIPPEVVTELELPPNTTIQTPIYAPKCLCILSHYPFFSIFKDLLRELYTISRGTSPVPIERYIRYLATEIPLPPPGVTLNFTLRGGSTARTQSLLRPSPRQFSLTDFPLKTIFECLGVGNVVTLFASVVCEQKILFYSEKYSLLTMAAEAMCAFLYPFYWHHVYIPILPRALIEFLQAPTPFIMGIHASIFSKVKRKIDLSSIVFVDLDRGSLTLPTGDSQFKKVRLPKPERAALSERLKRLLTPEVVDVDNVLPDTQAVTRLPFGTAPGPRGPNYQYLDLEIRACFLMFFVSVFPDYHRCISFLRLYPQPIAVFNKATYLSAHPLAAKFLSVFLETQSFAFFLEQQHRLPYSLFDEAIIHVRSGKNLEFIYERERAAHASSPRFGLPPPDAAPVGVRSGPVDPYAAATAGGPFRYEGEFPRQLLPERFGEAPSEPPAASNQQFQRLVEAYEEENRKLSTPYAKASAISTSGAGNALLAGDKKAPVVPVPRTVSTSSAAAASSEHEREQAAHEFLAQCLDQVFAGRPLDTASAELLDQLFTLEYGRHTFATLLTTHKNKDHGDLPNSVFTVLSDLTNRVLREANEVADFRSPALLMTAASSYYGTVGGIPEFLYSRIKHQKIWRNLHFWEAAFFDMLQARRQTELPPEIATRAEDWDTMDPSKREQCLEMENSLIFKVLSSIAYNMLTLGMPADEARHFISRMSNLSDLSDEQTTILFELINNIKRVDDMSDKQREGIRAREAAAAAAAAAAAVPKKGKRSSFRRPKTTRDNASSPNADIGDANVDMVGEPDSTSAGTSEMDSEWAHIEVDETDTLEYFTTSLQKAKERSERGKAKELYQRLLELRPKPGGGSAGGPAGAAAGSAAGGDDMSTKQQPRATHVTPTETFTERKDGYAVTTLHGHAGALDCVQTDGRVAVSGSSNGTVMIWDLSTSTCVNQLIGHSDRVSCLSLPRGPNALHLAASGSFDKTLRVWDIAMGRCVHVLREHTGSVCALEFQGNIVVSGSYDNHVKLWDVRSGRCVATLTGHTGPVITVCANTANGVGGGDEWVVSGSRDTSVRIWDLRRDKAVMALTEHTDWVRTVRLLPVADIAGMAAPTLRILSGSFDTSLKLWDPKTGRCLRTMMGHAGSVNCVATAPEAHMVVSGSGDGSLKIWDVRTGECRRTLKGHGDEVVCALIASASATGSGRIVSGSFDQTIRVWDAKTGKCRKVLRGHTDWVYGLSVASATKLVSCSWDGTVKVWTFERSNELVGDDGTATVDILPEPEELRIADNRNTAAAGTRQTNATNTGSSATPATASPTTATQPANQSPGGRGHRRVMSLTSKLKSITRVGGGGSGVN